VNENYRKTVNAIEDGIFHLAGSTASRPHTINVGVEIHRRLKLIPNKHDSNRDIRHDGTFFGIKVVENDKLPPNSFAFVNKNGDVLKIGKIEEKPDDTV
jgi:hypothetical protein